MKSVILSKSCSRCGGSTIFKGRALQKSVRDPVRSGVRKKRGQKRTCRALRGRLGALPENRPSPGRPTRRPKNFKMGLPQKKIRRFFSTFWCFVARMRSGRVPDRFRRLRGRFRTRFSSIFAILCGGFRRDLGEVCRIPPGCCRDLRNPLCGVPLGYGDLAKRFKFAVPLRGAGVVLDGSVKSPVPEGFPFLTFPAASARPPTPPA